MSKAAVEAFQRAKKLTEDGIAGHVIAEEPQVAGAQHWHAGSSRGNLGKIHLRKERQWHVRMMRPGNISRQIRHAAHARSPEQRFIGLLREETQGRSDVRGDERHDVARKHK